MTKKLTSALSQVDHQLTEHAEKLEVLLDKLKVDQKELARKGSPLELQENKNMIEKVKNQLNRIKFGG